MKIILVDLNTDLIDAWQIFFNKYQDVEIIYADATKLQADAIVSPANSFGFMDGGIDFNISERFGWDLQVVLQEKIKALPMRELTIGNALVVETKDSIVPYLISAPTMRVPMVFNISTSLNAYLAMKAALVCAKEHPEINSMIIPGLCTGIGNMNPKIAAKQMFYAYNEIILNNFPVIKTFEDSQRYQYNLNPEALNWNN